MFVKKKSCLLLACILALCVGCSKQNDTKKLEPSKSSLSITEIYKIEDESEFLNALDTYLTDKASNDIDNLNEVERNLYLALNWKKEKDLGLYSYFISDAGYYYKDTIKVLQLVGAYYDAEILEMASEEIELSKDIDKRKEEIKDAGYQTLWNQLDESLSGSYDDIDEKCYYYAMQHKEMMQ